MERIKDIRIAWEVVMEQRKMPFSPLREKG